MTKPKRRPTTRSRTEAGDARPRARTAAGARRGAEPGDEADLSTGEPTATDLPLLPPSSVADIVEEACYRVALQETSAQNLAALRGVVLSCKHEIVSSGVGAAGLANVETLVESDTPPDIAIVSDPAYLARVPSGADRRTALLIIGPPPLHALSRQAAKVEADGFLVRPARPDVVSAQLRALGLLAAARHELRQTQRALAAQTQRLSRLRQVQDPADVVGELFDQVAHYELARSRRYGSALSMLAISLVAADTLAPAGPLGVVRARALAALRHGLREIELTTRVGDHRFLTLLPGTDVGNATAVAHRIVKLAKQQPPVQFEGAWYPAEVVIGLASAGPSSTVSSAQLMRNAEAALELARKQHVPVEVWV